MILIIFMLLMVSGCGFARGQHTLLSETANLLPAKSLQSEAAVQVFTKDTRPKIGCVKVAAVVANGNAYATQEDLIETLKAETFRVGADTVVVVESGQTSQTVGTYGGGIALAEQINFPHLAGVACRTGSIWHGIRFDHTKPHLWMVRYVYDGSPADKAGIHEGDEIVAINGGFLGDDQAAWDREVNAKPPQTIVPVQLVRQGQKYRVNMVLESPPISAKP